MIKACIFDLDGTLCNTLDSIAYFCNQTLKQLGYSNIPTDKYRSLVGNGAEQLIHNMFHLFDHTIYQTDAHQIILERIVWSKHVVYWRELPKEFHCFLVYKAMVRCHHIMLHILMDFPDISP